LPAQSCFIFDAFYYHCFFLSSLLFLVLFPCFHCLCTFLVALEEELDIPTVTAQTAPLRRRWTAVLSWPAPQVSAWPTRSGRVDPLLAQTGVALCWENFAGRKEAGCLPCNHCTGFMCGGCTGDVCPSDRERPAGAAPQGACSGGAAAVQSLHQVLCNHCTGFSCNHCTRFSCCGNKRLTLGVPGGLSGRKFVSLMSNTGLQKSQHAPALATWLIRSDSWQVISADGMGNQRSGEGVSWPNNTSATLVYAFLLSLLAIHCAAIRNWLLRHWWHRIGKRSREVSAPLIVCVLP
jgi:hypothetical protein